MQKIRIIEDNSVRVMDKLKDNSSLPRVVMGSFRAEMNYHLQYRSFFGFGIRRSVPGIELYSITIAQNQVVLSRF